MIDGTKLNRFISLGCILMFLISCGSSSSNFFLKNYDRITSEYNTLFNGKKALDIGLNRIEDEVSENYFDLLSIEVLPVENEFRHFDFAESKALKVIELNQSDEELFSYSSQVAEAILLLIKARYYNNEYIHALEALNQLKAVHFNAHLPIEKYYWSAKINLRLGKTNEAIDLLEELYSNQDLNKKHSLNVKKTLAEAYLKNEEYLKSIDLIRELLTEKSNAKEHRRLGFILAQVLEISDDRQSALDEYRNLQVENKKDVFLIHSLSRLFDLDSNRSISENILVLEKLKDKFGYRKYDHYINHYLGKLYLENSDFKNALSFFRESQKSPNVDVYTSRENQKILYHLYLMTKDFDKATNELNEILNWKQPNYHLKVQETVLNRLILVENQLEKTDSLLALSNIGIDEIKTIFDTQIIENNQSKSLNIPSNPEEIEIETSNKLAGNQKPPTQKSSFVSQWGNRPNVDNWRNSQLIGVSYQNKPDLTSKTTLTENEKLIIWNDFLASIENIKNNKFTLEQQYANLIIEQIELYLWFGLFEKAKLLIDERSDTLNIIEKNHWQKRIMKKFELNENLMVKNYYIAKNRI